MTKRNYLAEVRADLAAGDQPNKATVARANEMLRRFAERRNNSAHFSNLQFQIDLESCGMRIADIGEPEKISDTVYRWTTPVGIIEEDQTNRIVTVS